MIDSCTVYDDVQAGKLFTNDLDSIKNGLSIAHVTDKSHTAYILLFKAAADSFNCILIDIDTGNHTILSGKGSRRGLAQATACTCHQDNFPFEYVFLHERFLIDTLSG